VNGGAPFPTRLQTVVENGLAAASGTGPGVAAELSVRVCHCLDDVAPGHWDALGARPPASLIGSRPWVEAALATVDRGCVPFLVAVETPESLVGLMTLVLDQFPPRPVLRFAGSPFNDLTDLMTLAGHELPAGAAAIEALRMLVSNGCAMDIGDLDPEGALAHADRDRRMFDWDAASGAPTLALHDPNPSISARERRRLDRSLRALRAVHRVEFRRTDGEEMVTALGDFIRLRAARLRALGRNVADPPVTLLDAAVRRLAPLGRCAFMEMQLDGAVVARDLYLLDGTVAMLWLRALDLAWLRYSCGHLLLRATGDRLAAQGYDTLDFGRGDELYKFRFGGRERVLLRARLPPP
jgi:CelD/BcsL family acetyltransferase involved in cellulose biosynthesis